MLVITVDCVVCTKCAKSCPVQAIPDTPYQVHQIDTSKCVLCGLCINDCAYDAIKRVPLKAQEPQKD